LQYQDPLSFTQTLNSNPNGSFDNPGMKRDNSKPNNIDNLNRVVANN